MHGADKPETKRKCKANIELYHRIAGREGNQNIINVDCIPRNFMFISPKAAGEGLVNFSSNSCKFQA